MIVSVDIDDMAWLTIENLEAQAIRIAQHCAHRVDCGAEPMEVAILFTDDDTVAELNRTWRGKEGPTNVLSFPAPNSEAAIAGMPRPFGDIALAYGVVAREAQEQGKSLAAHTAHLLVHGMLHLAGHDHLSDADAEAMEACEIGIMRELGYADPYRDDTGQITRARP